MHRQWLQKQWMGVVLMLQLQCFPSQCAKKILWQPNATHSTEQGCPATLYNTRSGSMVVLVFLSQVTDLRKKYQLRNTLSEQHADAFPPSSYQNLLTASKLLLYHSVSLPPCLSACWLTQFPLSLCSLTALTFRQHWIFLKVSLSNWASVLSPALSELTLSVLDPSLRCFFNNFP